MNLSMPSRQLIRGSSPILLLPKIQSLSLHTTPSNSWFWKKKSPSVPEETSSITKTLSSGSKDARKQLVDHLTSSIQTPTIFDDQIASPSSSDSEETRTQKKLKTGIFTSAGASLVKEHLARSTDPDPASRIRWERKQLIRQIHNKTDPFSKEPRHLRILRTERSLTSKSSWLPTSTKKLVKLAHQITGKPVSEALVQMRFSKKKMAQEVKYQLEQARDLAVVERGMGLGEAKGEVLPEQAAIEFKTKDGKHLKVTDPTRMYVAEAWVNRGPWRGVTPDYRARGRVFRKMKPTTSITVVLKEEKTRIREHKEREHKKNKQGPWIHLPNRPVTAQRPYYTW
ncbi:ribosomal protein L22/L17 [Podospora fimiseda]|uniref:Ribosomal protein L22/L17 n=1 Tax=Podospora fimiseda TaxID=252190 RepID=A0AAN6YMW8_9PEZI|nr:ribosomal protein L22/L17 [Podospora fimiseda]